MPQLISEPTAIPNPNNYRHTARGEPFPLHSPSSRTPRLQSALISGSRGPNGSMTRMRTGSTNTSSPGCGGGRSPVNVQGTFFTAPYKADVFSGVSPNSGRNKEPRTPLNLKAPSGILPELAQPTSSSGRQPFDSRGAFSSPHSLHASHARSLRSSGGTSGRFAGKSLNVGSVPPPSLARVLSVNGDPLPFSETNLDWTKLNIFRTRLCDRLTQTKTCYMANRCLFSHDVNWPRRTPFLPRASALTLRYVPVWCPRLPLPPLIGVVDSSGKVSWTSSDEQWNACTTHQNCTRADNCPFVHNVEEFLYHPEIYKSRMCPLAGDSGSISVGGNGGALDPLNSAPHHVSICPWYFCPFAHDTYELRDLSTARVAWFAPPQIVEDQFVARTQDFSDFEMRIIEFIRKSPQGALDLYHSYNSPLIRYATLNYPPVIRPINGSSLEQLVPSLHHRQLSPSDKLIHFMMHCSFLNLLLYAVENFFIPTLLSLQCGLLYNQFEFPSSVKLDCASLLRVFDSRGSSSVLPGSPHIGPSTGMSQAPSWHQVSTGSGGSLDGLASAAAAYSPANTTYNPNLIFVPNGGNEPLSPRLNFDGASPRALGHVGNVGLPSGAVQPRCVSRDTVDYGAHDSSTPLSLHDTDNLLPLELSPSGVFSSNKMVDDTSRSSPMAYTPTTPPVPCSAESPTNSLANFTLTSDNSANGSLAHSTSLTTNRRDLDNHHPPPPTPSATSDSHHRPTQDLDMLLDLLQYEELLKMMDIIQGGPTGEGETTTTTTISELHNSENPVHQNTGNSTNEEEAALLGEATFADLAEKLLPSNLVGVPDAADELSG